MVDPTLQTSQMHELLDRMQAGDREAFGELLRHVSDRLERLACKMRRKFPSVASHEETHDLMQKAIVRLLRALQQQRPDSVQGFFSLAAEQMRRELLDLVRYYRAQKRQAPPSPRPWQCGETVPLENVPEQATDPQDLDRWGAFHEAVTQLSARQREVVGLIFYHGWTQAEVADFFGVEVRTIRRWWQEARLQLHTALKEVDLVGQ